MRTRQEGSSPLARGLRLSEGDHEELQGIIPARAGFTCVARAHGCGGRDHPRSRGVYMMPTPLGMASPWIIPARAGFTSRRRCGRLLRRDHPRSRGVYGDVLTGGEGVQGSSPLARGLPAGHVPGDTSAGIIPARAGFTCGRAPSQYPARDHPRSRGVYPRYPESMTPTPGSSPLARGLLPKANYGDATTRIIPARAGFTHQKY